MEGNYNHTAHSFSIVSSAQNPTTKTQNKTRTNFFLPTKSKKSTTSYQANQENNKKTQQI
jgi:hypothetical protein